VALLVSGLTLFGWVVFLALVLVYLAVLEAGYGQLMR
jgi:hypothetical protein